MFLFPHSSHVSDIRYPTGRMGRMGPEVSRPQWLPHLHLNQYVISFSFLKKSRPIWSGCERTKICHSWYGSLLASARRESSRAKEPRHRLLLYPAGAFRATSRV